MSLSETDQQFIRANPSAAMITIARDGTPKVARVGVALVDGRLWSSATNERVRTKRLRRELDEDDFLQVMIDEQRVVYEFAVQHAYGMH